LETDAQVLCPQCQKQPPQFHQSFIPFQYRAEIVNLIRNFKFSGNLTSGRVIAELFCRKLDAADIAFPEALVPVPLHPSRIRKRGFNQALWLADKISRYTGIPVNHNLVSRTVKSRAQHQLNKSARLRNLEKAFKIESSSVNDQNFPAHIAIVDDVVTTGATANTIASLFNHKSDIRIQLWAIARTPLE
jgi:ComF family protein